MPVLRGAATADTGASTALSSFTITNPSSGHAGDVVLLYAVLRGTSTFTTPAGFTARTALVFSSTTAQVFWRVTDGSEGATFTVAYSAAGIATACVISYSGADTSAVFDPSAPATSGAAGTGTLPAASITTTRNGDQLVWFGASKCALSTDTPGTITPPAGFTSQVTQHLTTGASSPNMTSLVADATQATAGATGTETGTTTNSTEHDVALVVAIPAPAGGGPQALPYTGGQVYRQRVRKRRQLILPAPAAAAPPVTAPAPRPGPVQARQLPQRGGRIASRAGTWTGTTTVTATQGGVTKAGMALRVEVLTGTAAVQNGATASQSGVGSHEAAITTTVTGSRVYVASALGAAGPQTADAATTAIDNYQDVTNTQCYSTGRTTSATGTPGAVTAGFSLPNGNGGGAALAEILPAGTITEDASGPPLAATETATTVASASFTPPPGSLLVALVVTDFAVGVVTMTVSGGGLAWTEAVKSNGSSQNYSGVWIAQVPAGAASSARPAAVPVRARPVPLPSGRTASRDGTYAGTGPAVRALDGPVRARIPAPVHGGQADGRAGVFSGTGPALRALASAIAARLRVLPPRGRTAGRAGVLQGTGPGVRPLDGPVRAQPGPRRGGSVQSRAGTFTFVSLTSGPPVYPLHGPVQARRQPQRGGSTSSRHGIYAGTGPVVKPPQGPVTARQPLPPHGRAASRAGTFTAVVTGSGPPVYPAGHPVQARRLPQRGGRVIRAAGTWAGTGTPAIPLRRPAGLGRQQPPPPARGRVASQRGPYGGTGPPVVPLRHPVRGQPQKPVLTGRAAGRAGIAVFVPPPPFTVGALSSSDTSTSTLTAAAASSALAAATAAQDTLTATDQRTGGPS